MIDTLTDVYGNPMQAVLLGYLAGIIDGEGTIRLNRTMGRKTTERRGGRQQAVYAPQMSVGMVDRRIPELLMKHLGGSILEERVPGKRSIWRWTVTSRKQAVPILELLIPYLIVKREQAEVLLAYCRSIPALSFRQGVLHGCIPPQEIQRREETYLAMRKLNAVGAAATTK